MIQKNISSSRWGHSDIAVKVANYPVFINV